MNQCKCGRSYTKREWAKLADRIEWVIDPGDMVEMRQCVECKRYITVELPKKEVASGHV